ncbi:MAG: glycosyltransferase family 39 protein [Thermoguttaceae bacterium]|nr:glycosyltransferase family 39 protein [Thermoguttaceae bacterium]
MAEDQTQTAVSETESAGIVSEDLMEAVTERTEGTERGEMAPFSFWTGWCALVLILAFGLTVRLLILTVFDGQTLQIVDEQHYDAIGVYLHETGNYGTQEEAFVSIRPPFYPWFLSVLYGVFGVQNHLAVRCVQIAVSLLSVVCVYGLALETGFLSRRASLLAAAVFCFYPSLLAQNFFLLTETFFTFWLLLVLWTGLRFLRTGSLYAAGFCGIFIALGALTRSILWLAPIPFSLFILIWPNGALSWKKRTAGALLLVLFSGIGMAPWMVRNTRLQKTFTAIDCMSGRNLMMGNYEFTPLYRAWDAISMTPPHDWYTVLKEDLAENENISLNPKTQGEKDRFAADYAKKYIKTHPAQTLKRDAVKALCFWQLERSVPAGLHQGFWGIERIESPTVRKLTFAALTLCIFGVYALVFLTAVWGIFSIQLPKGTGAGMAFLTAVVLYFWILHSLAFAHERYHLPLVPILLLFAANFAMDRGKVNRFGVFSHFRKRPVRMTAALLMCGSFLVFWGCEILWFVG